ncbi:MAG TPA: EAL domain-containing response regulator [Rhodospirillaceae bacterium]|nr:EAL domain-containing response regulator [Rhodospirillaceae bacterium]
MNERLLILDDEPGFAGFVGQVAEGGGYDVRIVDDPQDFLRLLDDWPPTHIILDLAMPKVDGVEMLRHLADRQNRSQILIMSGFDNRVLDAAVRLGNERGLAIFGSVQKPIRAKELRAVLDRMRMGGGALDAGSLDQALAAGDITPFYQPKVDLQSMQPTGFEALVRWRHADRGTICPDQFMPMAEASGRIDRLTEAVTTRAMSQTRIWHDQGMEVTVAINLSALSLDDEDLADRIQGMCRATGARHDAITFEVTETAAMANPLRGLDILTRLRIKGFKLSIDDFGTGYSSLVQLHRLPFSELKIDRSFVAECDTSSEARVIVKTMVDLGHNLDMTVVGEGVESEAVAKILAELGCDTGQGFAIARPMEAEQVPGWLAQWDGHCVQ